jgi:hypothetical protein
MNWNTPGVDEMQMHRGAGFTVPDEIREQIITMDAQGMEVEDIIGMGISEDVVSQVLIENKVEGRNPAQAMQPMKFPTGQSMAGKYPSSPQDEIGKSFNKQLYQDIGTPREMPTTPSGGAATYPMQDPREMDIMNPRFNRY